MKECCLFTLVVALFALYIKTTPPRIEVQIQDRVVEKEVIKEVPVEVVREVPVSRTVVKWRHHWRNISNNSDCDD